MSNFNEEFIVKFTTDVTNNLNLNINQQKALMNTLYKNLQFYEVNQTSIDPDKNDLDEKITLYLQTKKLEGCVEDTIRNTNYFLREFSEFINKPINKITTNDLRMFISSKSDKLKSSTINNKISQLKSFFGWLQEEEYISGNPSKKLKGTKVPIRLRESLNIMELEKLRLACSKTRERALLEFLLATGCRVSEVVNTDIKDLDFSKNTIRVIGKGNKERIVCFSDKTKLHIMNYLNERTDDNEALFVCGKRPYKRLGSRGLEKIIHGIADKAGFDKPVYPHLMRHSLASIGLQSGADITTIQHLLGHTSITTTQRYAATSFNNVKHEYNQYMTI